MKECALVLFVIVISAASVRADQHIVGTVGLVEYVNCEGELSSFAEVQYYLNGQPEPIGMSGTHGIFLVATWGEVHSTTYQATDGYYAGTISKTPIANGWYQAAVNALTTSSIMRTFYSLKDQVLNDSCEPSPPPGDEEGGCPSRS